MLSTSDSQLTATNIQYNTVISIVMQDKPTFNWTKQKVKQLENLKCFEILPMPCVYNRDKKSYGNWIIITFFHNIHGMYASISDKI